MENLGSCRGSLRDHDITLIVGHAVPNKFWPHKFVMVWILTVPSSDFPIVVQISRLTIKRTRSRHP